MMDPSEINNFENQWKKAFDEASETPPPSVWEGIEARLDHDENNKIIPLWWRNPKMWYAAASIAALLLVGGGGIWFNSRSGISSGTGTEMAAKTQSANETKTAADEMEKGSGNNGVDLTKGSDEVANEQTIAKNPDSVISDKTVASSTQTEEIKRKQSANGTESILGNKSAAAVSGKDEYALNTKSKANSAQPGNAEITGAKSSKEAAAAVIEDITPETNISERTVASFSQPQNSKGQAIKEENVASQNAAIEANALNPIPFKDLDVFMQKRYVFFKTEAQPLEKSIESESKKPKEYWAGLGFMPATFNPDVQIKEAPTAFVGQLASRQKSLTGTNKAGASYAVQTQGGMRLSKHWSMELGVNYLKGNSRYEGGGYVVSAYNNASSNVLQDALVGLASSNGDKSPGVAGPGTGKNPTFASTNTIYIDVNKKVSNDYQYLQLPVQAGFTLNPDKKLSYSVLGGMMANFFLSNELESASGETITTTASDEVYRSMNWAATTGLRFNYTLSSKWKASLTGSYQKAITSGFRTNQSLESHPYLYGVSWGVRYSF